MAMAVRGLLLLVLLIAPSMRSASDNRPANWQANGPATINVRNIELYQSGFQRFGKLLWSSENGAKPAFILFREFS
jgi:hypothetical protein